MSLNSVDLLDIPEGSIGLGTGAKMPCKHLTKGVYFILIGM